jgi:hypothetical protein
MTTEKKEVPMADKNQNSCGCDCGCMGATQEDPETLKHEGGKPEK